MLISTRMSEIGEEQFSGRFFKDGMTDVSYSPELRQAVAAGPTSIKVSTLPGALRHNVARFAQRLAQPGKPSMRTMCLSKHRDSSAPLNLCVVANEEETLTKWGKVIPP